MQLRREQVDRRHGHQREEAVDVPWSRGQELAIETHDLRRLLDQPERRSGDHRGADRVRAKRELRDDAEVTPAATQRPEQIGVLGRVRAHRRAVGEHNLGAGQAVDRQAETACQMAEPATEREPPDARCRDDPRRRRPAVRGGRLVDLSPRAAAADAHPVGAGVDHHCRHARKVDDDAIVDDAEAAAVVSAAADRERHPMGSGQRDRARDVVGAGAAHDERRMAVDHAVVDRARGVVVRIAGCDDAGAPIGEFAASALGKWCGGGHEFLSPVVGMAGHI